MKPLLIVPPAPQRWHALEGLLGHKGPLWLQDVEQRFAKGIKRAQDAFAVIPDGGHFIANVCINKCGDVGVLGHVFVRPEHRGRGHVRRLMGTAITWFEMTGGRRLVLGTTADLAEGLFAKFGFEVIHRVAKEPHDGVMMRRVSGKASETVAENEAAPLRVGDVTRREWPLVVALLQCEPGADPRASLAESAVGAELIGLDLLSQQDRGTCRLLGAYRGDRLVGIASIATDQLGQRTFAMRMPHSQPQPELREALLEFARSKGYEQVDFPMETLGAAPVQEPSDGSAS
jgi:GNAT superfamily N-acetyltransferase